MQTITEVSSVRSSIIGQNKLDEDSDSDALDKLNQEEISIKTIMEIPLKGWLI